MSDELPELSRRQREYISLLPASTPGVAEEMSIAETTVESYRNAIQEKLGDADTNARLEYDPSSNQWALVGTDSGSIRRLSTEAKQTITKKANQYRTEMEARLLRRLPDAVRPLTSIPEYNSGEEDMVLAFGDLHIGDTVETEHGEVFNPKIAAKDCVSITRRTLKLRRMMDAIADIRNLHVFYNGDNVTGMDVYDGQAFDVKLGLGDQLALAVELLWRQLTTFAEHFETVTVTCTLGNHGRDRGSYKSGQANQDLNCYRWVADRLRAAGHDNIDFHISGGEHSVSREIRGHTYLHRHGQHEQVHAGATARSQADQRGLLYANDFDVQVRGHYHQERKESILNAADVITTPSPKPGDEFAELIGQPDCGEHRRLAKVWRISDKRPIAGETTIDDIDREVPDDAVPTIEDVRERYRAGR
jgi:hypothetical protein